VKLLLDIGNTRIKWAYVDDDRLLHVGEIVHRGHDATRIAEFVEQLPEKPGGVFAANVAGTGLGRAVSQAIDRRFGLPVRFAVTDRECGPVRNGYDDIAQLGVDRWAAIVGAYTHVGSAVCVVDAGTAVTVDLVRDGGQHLGGLIVPGLTVMRESLEQDTGDIGRFSKKSVEQPAVESFPGRNTASAVRQGTMAALVALIDSCVVALKTDTGTEAELVLTGGDASDLLAALIRPAVHKPLLVLEGLKKLAG